jgi:Cd2+/Zn2+-exporting ATPase
MNRMVRLDLPILLPDVQDLRDRCVARLVSLLERRDGVERVHVVDGSSEGAREIAGSATTGHEPRDGGADGGAKLCLHYDPARLSLAQVSELARFAGAEVSNRFGHAVVAFRMVGAEDDGQRLERALCDMPGVTAASVNFAAQFARVEFDRTIVDAGAINQRLRELGAVPAGAPAPARDRDALGATGPGEAGPAAAPRADEHAHDAEAPAGPPAGWFRRNRELVWSLTAGVLLAGGWLAERQLGAGPAVIGLYLASYFFGARDNVGHFVADLRRGRFHFNIDLLMVVAAAGAAILGQWVEGALLLFLFSLGHALEHYALGRARNAIKALGELAPQSATVVRDGREQGVPIAEVRPNDLVVVKPAERIPVDGVVKEGRSAVNQAPITGESVPVEKAAGEKVFAGSVNGEGALVVSVTAAVGDRTLDRVIKLVAEAQTQKAPTQQFTDRFERVFVPLVLVADVLLIVVPPLVGVWTWSESFYRAMTLLVAASPCALALGTPAAVLAGIAQAARNGVLIKGGAHLEALGTIDVLALDKTGTITKGEPAVTDVVALNGTSEATLLATAAAAETRSQHPLARAIVGEASARSLELPATGDLESETGFGIRTTIAGDSVEVGRLGMFERETGDGAPAPPVPNSVREAVARLQQAGRTTVVVRRTASQSTQMGSSSGGRQASDDGWLGVIGIADEPRANAPATLERLRAVGMKRIVMLTGDNQGVGDAVGRAVGVDEVRAGLLPEDKVEAIRTLAEAGRVAMVGDGVNDAPALAHATVGIAMGGAGTAAALETADVALMGDDLGRLPFAVGLSRKTRGVIRQNLYVSLGVIALLVVAAVTGVVGIGPAVVVHEGSTLVVIANALRLLAYKGNADERGLRL